MRKEGDGGVKVLRVGGEEGGEIGDEGTKGAEIEKIIKEGLFWVAMVLFGLFFL